MVDDEFVDYESIVVKYRYHQVCERFWADEKVIRWGDSEKCLAAFLLSSHSHRAGGLFRIPIETIAGELRWDTNKVREKLSFLESEGFAIYDPETSVIFLPNAIKYLPAFNTNQKKSIVRLFQELPRTELQERFINACETRPELFEECFLKVLRKHCVTLSKAFGNHSGTLSKPFASIIYNRSYIIDNNIIDNNIINNSDTPPENPDGFSPPPPGAVDIDVSSSPSSKKQAVSKIKPPRTRAEITDPDFLEVFALWQRKKGGQPRTAGYNRWKALLEAGYSGKDLLSAGREYFAQKDRQAEREHKLTDPKFIQAFETFYGPNLRFEGFLPSEMAALKNNTAMDNYLKDKGVMKEDGTAIEVKPDELADDDLPDWCKDKVPDVRGGSGDGIERDKLSSPLPVPSGGN